MSGDHIMNITREEKRAKLKEILKQQIEPGETPKGDIELLKGRFVSYTDEEELVIEFPIADWQRNGLGNLQGGMVSFIMDCCFGVLGYVNNNCNPIATIEMTCNFLRPMGPEQKSITMRTRIRSRGRRVIHALCDAYNAEGKLVATSSTNIMRL
jgi:uncharacterized protein (TIGR00369 family)